MNKLNNLLQSITILSEEQLKQFEMYANILQVESKKYNLTTITDLEDIYVKHFYDSLLLAKMVNLNQNIKLADLGSGAGFPGIPLKIAFPNLDITLIEPTTKRCKFLEQVIEKLNLQKIKVINDRAENYVEKERELFDLLTARAVAPLNILLELAIPLLKINGEFIALKGSNAEEEMKEAQNALKKLSARLTNQLTLDLPNDKGTRSILEIQKVKATNSIYPRQYAKIKKQPL